MAGYLGYRAVTSLAMAIIGIVWCAWKVVQYLMVFLTIIIKLHINNDLIIILANLLASNLYFYDNYCKF